jgi:hypothetical protein
MVSSPRALAASSRCRPSTSTKRAPSGLTKIGDSQLFIENAGGDLVYSFPFEGRTTLDRNIDVRDWDGLALHHDRTKG